MQAATASRIVERVESKRGRRSKVGTVLQRAIPLLDRATARVQVDAPVLERALRLLEPTLSLRAVRARVVEKYPETHDVTTFVLQPNARFGTFHAGAYVTVHLRIDGRPVERAYSISSAPAQPGRIAITVKRVPGGLASNYLTDRIEVGDVLTLSGPAGRFLLPDPRPRDVLMLSAGSGITPVMAMLRQLERERADTKVTFLHFARSPRDLIFASELERLSRTMSSLEVHTCVESADAGWPHLRGRFRAELLEQCAPNFRELDVFLCGPSPFMQSVMQVLEASGADLARLRYERFNAAFDASRFLSRAAEVRFLRSGREVITGTTRTLLEEAEALGLRVPSSCRAGNCGTCRCRKLSGVVTDVITGRDSSPDDELIYPCISLPRGVVELDL